MLRRTLSPIPRIGRSYDRPRSRNFQDLQARFARLAFASLIFQSAETGTRMGLPPRIRRVSLLANGSETSSVANVANIVSANRQYSETLRRTFLPRGERTIRIHDSVCILRANATRDASHRIALVHLDRSTFHAIRRVKAESNSSIVPDETSVKSCGSLLKLPERSAKTR